MRADLTDFTQAYLEDVQAQGFTNIRICGTEGLCGIRRYNFAWGLVVNIQPLGHGRRYCYESQGEAQAALVQWDGDGHPSGPWIKCKGANIDFLNPEFGRAQIDALAAQQTCAGHAK